MKNYSDFTPKRLAEIKEILRTSEITDGPNNFQLMLALFDGKKIFFHLDETVDIKITVSSLTLEGGDNDSKTKWLVKGVLEYAQLYFNFSTHYDSSLRGGYGREGFIEISELQ